MDNPAMIHGLLSEGEKPSPPVRRECRDGGTCHHKCWPQEACFREQYCVPLSISGLDDNWQPISKAQP